MSVALSAPASAEASVGAAALPTHIGKYRILGRLGDGATSEVFLGYDDFQRRNVAIKRVRAGDRRRPDRQPLLRALLRRRGGARRPAAAPERRPDLRRRARPGGALPGHGVRRRQHAAPVLPRRPAALARADRRDRLQVRDGARLRLSPGPDPPRRQAGEPARGAHQRHDHRRQDQRLRQRPEPRLGRDADPSRRLARLHVARAARRRHHRLPRRHLLARRRALPPHRRPAALRCAGAVGHDASDLQRQAGSR